MPGRLPVPREGETITIIGDTDEVRIVVENADRLIEQRHSAILLDAARFDLLAAEVGRAYALFLGGPDAG